MIHSLYTREKRQGQIYRCQAKIPTAGSPVNGPQCLWVQKTKAEISTSAPRDLPFVFRV